MDNSTRSLCLSRFLKKRPRYGSDAKGLGFAMQSTQPVVGMSHTAGAMMHLSSC